MTEFNEPVRTETNVAVVGDRGNTVRWGAVIAGLFAAMAALAFLAVLGVAIGLSSVDAGDRAANFGIGAGIWGAASALIAFFIGGYLAARSAGGRGAFHGTLNGTMVWVVTIPLLIYLLAGGVSALFGAVGSAAATTANVASNAAGAAATDNPNLRQDVNAATQNVTEAVKDKAQEIKKSVTPQDVEKAAHSAAAGAWGTLIAMILGLAAAAIGGYVGSMNLSSPRRRID